MSKPNREAEIESMELELAALRARVELMTKYSETNSRLSFFISGFLNSCRFTHLSNHYHGNVNPDYFDDVVWGNVGKYLYKGMDGIERDEKTLQGIKAKFQQQTL